MAGQFVTEVNDSNFEQDVLKSDQPVLVDFWAAWCGPCRALAPTVDELASEYHGKIKVMKMDVDKNSATPSRYGIRGIPALLLFKDGKVADQLVGLFGATCMHFGGDVRGLRGFLSQQGAPVMPAQARDAFLAGRSGQVFDVSVPGVNLALVSLDDGGCEAVAEKANGTEVLSTLQQAAREAGATMTPLGAQSDSGPNGVRHSAYQLAVGGKQMHVLVSTAPAAPQAVITLAPK